MEFPRVVFCFPLCSRKTIPEGYPHWDIYLRERPCKKKTLEGSLASCESSMREHGRLAVEQCGRDSLSEQGCGLLCPVLSQKAKQGASFLTPPVADFNGQDNGTTAAWTD